jgi:hypothetical protein
MKHLFYSLIFFTALVPCSLFSESWTVFLNMDSSDDMNDMAIKNISELMIATPRDHVTFALQLHAFGTTAYRYIIKNNALIPAGIVHLTDNRIQNFVDGAQWAFDTYPSDRTMLLLWDHGRGALDPQWNESTQKWEHEPDIESEANHLDPDEIFECTSACHRSHSSANHRLHHKGYMFSLTPREYLTNNDLISCLETIHKDIDHKLDIICFDTCMGAMLENAYQCSPFADYLVGVQSCAAKDGLHYAAFGEVFTSPTATPLDITTALVKTFEDYYTSRATQDVTPLDGTTDASSIFTLTALDLSKVAIIKELLDFAAQQINACTQIYGIKPLRKAFRTAHSKCYSLCLFPMYTDMYSLLSFFDTELELLEPSEQLTLLRNTLKKLCCALTDSVTAHCCGSSLQGKAHGISLYCPHYHIDSSYATIRFGKESQWGTALSLATGEIE